MDNLRICLVNEFWHNFKLKIPYGHLFSKIFVFLFWHHFYCNFISRYLWLLTLFSSLCCINFKNLQLFVFAFLKLCFFLKYFMLVFCLALVIFRFRCLALLIYSCCGKRNLFNLDIPWCLNPCFVVLPAGGTFCFERHNFVPKRKVCLKIKRKLTVSRHQKEEYKFTFMVK